MAYDTREQKIDRIMRVFEPNFYMEKSTTYEYAKISLDRLTNYELDCFVLLAIGNKCNCKLDEIMKKVS
jgi:hypothetical protein